jgi:hypothetical protein
MVSIGQLTRSFVNNPEDNRAASAIDHAKGKRLSDICVV